MLNTAKKYQILDDSYGDDHGKILFESDDRKKANKFYNEYEKKSQSQDRVALFQRNPKYIFPPR